MTSIEELNPELKGIGRYQFGWSDRDDAGATRAHSDHPHDQQQATGRNKTGSTTFLSAHERLSN